MRHAVQLAADYIIRTWIWIRRSVVAIMYAIDSVPLTEFNGDEMTNGRGGYPKAILPYTRMLFVASIKYSRKKILLDLNKGNCCRYKYGKYMQSAAASFIAPMG